MLGKGKPLIYILDVLRDKGFHSYVKVMFYKKMKDIPPDRILCTSENRSVRSVNCHHQQKTSVSAQEVRGQENVSL